MRTNRTFAVFSTEATRARDLSEETFHADARAILEALREKLMASGRTASAVGEHADYGMAFTVNDPPSGGPVYVLLQLDWLLVLERELTIFERLRRQKSEEVDETLVKAIDEALGSLGASSRYWCTSREHELMGYTEAPAFRAAGARKPKDILLRVYSADPPLQRGLIQSACLDSRLPTEFQWEIAFRRDHGAQDVEGDGAVATARVFGWHPDSTDAGRARAAIGANDKAALEELYSRDSISAVEI
jgi:hypothetical protein